MDDRDERLNDLTPAVPHEPIRQCPNCDSELDESTAFGVKVAATVIVLMPVLLVLLDFTAKMSGRAYEIDDKILASCLAGIALVLAFGFKKRKD